jgi:pyruvate,water dikinase
VIHRLSAIITDAGSPAGHLASVAREFGLPMLVNTGNASDLLDHGRQVTVHAGDKSVYAGTVTEMLESACAQPDLIIDSPFMRKLDYLMKFVATLDLVDPQADTFAPQYCRSLHDIIRFAHEKAVQEMFHVSDNRLRKLSLARKLASDIPMLFFVLDVGAGIAANAAGRKEISIDQIENNAMRALWAGLTHPDIQWGDFSHFDWAAHDRAIMSGGIASPESAMYASHAVISNDYMNLNLRFGYHFVIVDAQCGPESPEKIILFRFSGGGADMDQRMLRTDFLSRVLRRLGFDVTVVSDLIDGHFSTPDQADALAVLDMIGRLLGATRLMDMYLKDPDQIEGYVDDFMQGRYHFASTEM